MKRLELSRVGLIAVMLGTAGWSTSTYGADKADTTRAMLKLSAEAANAKARQDLLSILQPTGKFTRANRIRVSGIAMDTVPYGAGLTGLCRKDELFLTYAAPTDRRPNTVDDPLRPVGVETDSMFHVTNEAVSRAEPGTAGASAWNGNCAALKSKTGAQWFSAADARGAARGFNVLLAVRAAIQSGAHKIDNCTVQSNGTTCEGFVMGEAQADKLVEVKKGCPAERGDECYSLLFVGPIKLDIVVSFDNDDALEPSKIWKVSADEYIAVT